MSPSEAGISCKLYISDNIFIIIITFHVNSIICLAGVLDVMILNTFPNNTNYDTCTFQKDLNVHNLRVQKRKEFPGKLIVMNQDWSVKQADRR